MMQKMVLLCESVVEGDADIADGSGVQAKIAYSVAHPSMNDKPTRVRQQFEFLATAVVNETGGIIESELVVLVVGFDNKPAHQLVTDGSHDLRQRHGNVEEDLASKCEVSDANLIGAIGFNLKFAAAHAMNICLIACRR